MRETYAERTRLTIRTRTKDIQHGSDIHWQYRIYLFRLDIVENDRKIFQNNNLSSRAYLLEKARFYATRATVLPVHVEGNLLERVSGKKEESLRVLLYVCFVEQARHALSTTPLFCH